VSGGYTLSSDVVSSVTITEIPTSGASKLWASTDYAITMLDANTFEMRYANETAEIAKGTYQLSYKL